MDINLRLYKCEICNKNYASYKSLWCHNKKFHIDNDTKMTLKGKYFDTKLTLKSNYVSPVCKYCNKQFNFRQNKYQHEVRCKIKKQLDEKERKEKEAIESLKEIEIERIKLKQLKEATKQKKMELEIFTKGNTNNTNNGTINNNSHNTNTNNIVINQYGKESIYDLSIKDTKKIIDSKTILEKMSKNAGNLAVLDATEKLANLINE